MNDAVIINNRNTKAGDPGAMFKRLEQIFIDNTHQPNLRIAIFINDLLLKGIDVSIRTYQKRSHTTAYIINYNDGFERAIVFRIGKTLFDTGVTENEYLAKELDDTLIEQY